MTRLALAAAVLLMACGGRERPVAKVEAPRTAADSADAEVTRLGREIYHLLDLAADYRGSHRGRLPGSLRALGIDSLTPDIARSVGITAGEFHAGAAFRHPVGHQWISCEGQLKVLEDAVLGDGHYTLTCRSPQGIVREVQAGGALE